MNRHSCEHCGEAIPVVTPRAKSEFHKATCVMRNATGIARMRHDRIDAVKKELAAMREVGVLDERRYAAALRYVAANAEEVSDMCSYSSVSDVADSVASIAGSCASGKCE